MHGVQLGGSPPLSTEGVARNGCSCKGELIGADLVLHEAQFCTQLPEQTRCTTSSYVFQS